MSTKTNRPGPTSATPEALNGSPPLVWSNGVDLTFFFRPRLSATDRKVAAALAIQFAKIGLHLLRRPQRGIDPPELAEGKQPPDDAGDLQHLALRLGELIDSRQ